MAPQNAHEKPRKVQSIRDAKHSQKNKIRSQGLNRRGAATRKRIIEIARKQIIDQGLKNTTIGTITAELGITRPLFYHYFKNMDQLSDAVLTQYTDEFLQQVRNWDKERIPGDINNALELGIKHWKNIHVAGTLFGSPIISEGNGEMYEKFIHQAADRIADYIIQEIAPTFSNIPESEYAITEENRADWHGILYVLIQGLNALFRTNPDLSTNQAKRIAAYMLQLEAFIPSPMPVHNSCQLDGRN